MKTSPRKKAMRRAFAFRPQRICPNCGKPGSHYAPPSMGEEGGFICTEDTK